MIETILWDLDGTITLSDPGITRSVAYALEQMGKASLGDEQLRSFVGPPLKDSFMKIAGLTEEEALEAIRLYRVCYEAGAMFDNDPVPGIEALLKELSLQGRKNILATSKPEKYARMILEHFKLEPYFTDICGAEMHSRLEKEEVIAYALEKNQLQGDKSILMVGDRHYDVKGAARFGIRTIGVLFGYGSDEELKAAGAVVTVKDTAELKEALNSL